jgi:hypothetical protein
MNKQRKNKENFYLKKKKFNLLLIIVENIAEFNITQDSGFLATSY